MKNLDMGDMVIKDSGDLGFDIYHKNGNKLCFINKIGEVVLMKWLEKKNADKQLDWVKANVARTIKEQGL